MTVQSLPSLMYPFVPSAQRVPSSTRKHANLACIGNGGKRRRHWTDKADLSTALPRTTPCPAKTRPAVSPYRIHYAVLCCHAAPCNATRCKDGVAATVYCTHATAHDATHSDNDTQWRAITCNDQHNDTTNDAHIQSNHTTTYTMNTNNAG